MSYIYPNIIGKENTQVSTFLIRFFDILQGGYPIPSYYSYNAPSTHHIIIYDKLVLQIQKRNYLFALSDYQLSGCA